jgi:hypothetical protein
VSPDARRREGIARPELRIWRSAGPRKGPCFLAIASRRDEMCCRRSSDPVSSECRLGVAGADHVLTSALPSQRLKQFPLCMIIGGDSPEFPRKLMFGGQKKPVQPLVFFTGNKLNVGRCARAELGDLAAPILEHKPANFG